MLDKRLMDVLTKQALPEEELRAFAEGMTANRAADLVRPLDGLAQRVALVSAYLDARSAGASHERAMLLAARRADRVWRAMGYGG